MEPEEAYFGSGHFPVKAGRYRREKATGKVTVNSFRP